MPWTRIQRAVTPCRQSAQLGFQSPEPCLYTDGTTCSKLFILALSLELLPARSKLWASLGIDVVSQQCHGLSALPVLQSPWDSVRAHSSWQPAASPQCRPGNPSGCPGSFCHSCGCTHPCRAGFPHSDRPPAVPSESSAHFQKIPELTGYQIVSRENASQPINLHLQCLLSKEGIPLKRV